jgi:hypothetical protein
VEEVGMDVMVDRCAGLDVGHLDTPASFSALPEEFATPQ